MDLEGWHADFAVGGSVKWLCGGPGAGYLYVRPDLAATLEPALVGWAAHDAPFELRDRGRPLRRRAGALPERDAERAVALFGAGPATKSSPRSASRRSASGRSG